ncbi:MAG: hypoxanthine phosphoribosyltransferase [Gemmatimonadales bacterium]|nr:MAG: hypoxanthine phosphoribosyltransferase [Gemmatimonadales bacterium]
MSATAPEQVAHRAGANTFRHVVFSQHQIATRVAEMGAGISDHYPVAEPLLVLGLLKGSFIFMADLVRTIHRPLHLDFLVASSYGKATVSSGQVNLLYDPDTSFEGKHLLIVEDIIDSGNTLKQLLPDLRRRGAKSVEVCALLHKRLVALEPEARWVGFDCPDEFVVGYGLDHAEDFRHLPFIGSL